jgi:tRNA threonylcarbamoyladenosine biosynthesis protein TsaB
MLILAADTSGTQGSIALAECESGRCTILETVPLTGGTFSAQLVPQIAALLEKHGRSKDDLGAFAVVSGPGSFTGLRVGLAAIKALAEVLNKPIAAVSLLEAVVASGAARGRVLAALDAGRGDVYVGDYELDPQVKMHSERLLNREEFLAEARSGQAMGTTVVTPDALLAEMVRTAGIPVVSVVCPDSGAIARLGWDHLQQGQTASPEELEANYIRRSGAEIFSKPGR